MDKIIVTALLIIAGAISAILVFNALYPAIGQSSDAITSMQGRVDERMKSQIEIVHATKFGSDALVWVKNVGSLRISAPEACDVFFGPQGNFTRLSYNTGSGVYWQYSIEGSGTDWNPTTTMKITIKGYSFLGAGTRYFVKVVVPIGVSADYYFSE